MREKSGNRNQDVIIEKTYFLRCQRCGSEQMEHVLTIVSWSGRALTGTRCRYGKVKRNV